MLTPYPVAYLPFPTPSIPVQVRANDSEVEVVPPLSLYVRVSPVGISVSLRHPRDLATIAALCIQSTHIYQFIHLLKQISLKQIDCVIYPGSCLL